MKWAGWVRSKFRWRWKIFKINLSVGKCLIETLENAGKLENVAIIQSSVIENSFLWFQLQISFPVAQFCDSSKVLTFVLLIYLQKRFIENCKSVLEYIDGYCMLRIYASSSAHHINAIDFAHFILFPYVSAFRHSLRNWCDTLSVHGVIIIHFNRIKPWIWQL